jgi:hypothetical protein
MGRLALVLLLLVSACADENPGNQPVTAANCTNRCRRDESVCMDARASTMFNGSLTCKNQMQECLASCDALSPVP